MTEKLAIADFLGTSQKNPIKDYSITGKRDDAIGIFLKQRKPGKRRE